MLQFISIDYAPFRSLVKIWRCKRKKNIVGKMEQSTWEPNVRPFFVPDFVISLCSLEHWIKIFTSLSNHSFFSNAYQIRNSFLLSDVFRWNFFLWMLNFWRYISSSEVFNIVWTNIFFLSSKDGVTHCCRRRIIMLSNLNTTP